MGKEIEVKIDLDGVPTTFRLRKPTFGERWKHFKVSGVKVDPITGQVKSADDEAAFKLLIERLHDSIIEPIEYKEVEKLKTLPEDVVDYLGNEVNKISNISFLLKKDSEVQ